MSDHLYLIYFSRLNYLLGGLHPYGFHVVNVLLHLVATLLFTYCCRTVIFRKSSSALFAGLLFAVHPVHTEAVSIYT